jgi:PAS domain S-box-containing protein
MRLSRLIFAGAAMPAALIAGLDALVDRVLANSGSFIAMLIADASPEVSWSRTLMPVLCLCLGGLLMWALRGEDSTNDGDSAAGRDTSRLREDERQLEHLRSIVRRSPAVAITWLPRRDWAVEFVSESIEQFGYTPEQFTSGEVTFAEIVRAEDQRRLRAEVGGHIAAGRDRFSQKYRIITADGEERWVDDRTTVVRDEAGEIVRYDGILLDITERTRAEKALRESEELYRLIAENTVDAIWVMDLDMRFTWVNRAVERITGYTRDEWTGSRLAEHTTPDNFELMAEMVRNSMDLEAPSEGTVFETTIIHKDGHDVPVEISSRMIFDERGNPLELQGVTRDITERKRAEKQLQKRTRTLRERVKELRALHRVAHLSGDHDRPLDEVLQDLVDVLSVSWQWLQVTTARVELEGAVYEAGETEGPPVARQSAAITVDGEKIGQVEVRYHEERPEQDEGPFLAEERALIDAVSLAIGQTVERRRTRQEREVLARFPEENPMPVMRVGEDGVVDFANEAAVRLLADLGSGVGQPTPECPAEAIRRAIDTREPQQVEVRGGGRLFVFTCAPIAEFGYVNLYGMDITEHAAVKEALAESERRYRTVFENTGAATCLIAVDRTIVLANEGFAELAGVARDEIEGTVGFLEFVAPHERERMIGYHVARRTPGREAPRRYEFDFVTREGEQRRVFLHIDVIPGTSTAVASLADITELRRTQAQLQELTEELEERVRDRTAQLEAANNELEAFAYSVSHDLRAPLRAINGFSQAVVEDYGDKLDATGRDYLQRVRRASQRMGGLIDDLLQLSRITRVDLTRDRVDLSALAREIVDELRAGSLDRAVEVVIEPDLTADVDRRLMKTMLSNLLGNAWKYTGKMADAKIEFGSQTDERGRRVYHVTDTGAGFDMQYADKLFQPFQRLHREDEFPGTGIGLATVRRVIRRHGGDVWAEGVVDEGATFYFTLTDAQGGEERG